MKVDLFHWLEGPDQLEIGPYVGSLWIEADGVEIAVDDPHLEERLLELLDAPLSQVVSTPGGGTGRRPVDLGDADYFQALVERLARKDIRLHATPAPD